MKTMMARCCDVFFAEMANWPQFAGGPVPQQQQQQQPGPPSLPYEKNAAEFRPVTPFLQHSPRSFHQFRSGPPPPGHAVYGNVYPPSGNSPGFNQNSQGWSSPYPRGYPPNPNVIQHNFVAPLSQSQHVPMRASVVGSGLVPWSKDVRPNSTVKPLFLNWIDESVKASGDRIASSKSSDIFKLVDVVEETICKILALTDLQTSRTEFGVCPYNSRHGVPVDALLRHTLQCPEGTVEASSLFHSLQYPHTVAVDSTDAKSSNNVDMALFSVNYTPIRKFGLETLKQQSSPSETENEIKVGITDNWSEDGTLTLSTSKQQFDPPGSLFFYRQAPGVVVTSLAHCSSEGFGDPMSSMPPSLRIEIGKCPYVTLKNDESDGVVKESSSIRLLPSMVWSLRKELDFWKDMPSICSRTVLEAATCLGRVRKALILDWLLVHSPVYGVILDVAMAAHISCLVQLYLKALRTQSLTLLDLKKRDISITSDTVVVECPAYAEASTWLASWLSHLYGPINSKAVVLDVLKHCLNACGRFLSVFPLDLETEDLKVPSDKVIMEHRKMLPKGADNAVSNLEEVLEVKQVGAAMDALYERANFERYIKFGLSNNNATKTQRIGDYDTTVNFANNERAKRPNYRAVTEHDGLTWQRSQQEEKRNKTKAELLAEERDYKRRRMSYRGKKLKRTPLQVLHDIIENHMREITEAGGIGCFSKQPLHIPSVSHTESQQQLQGSIPKNSNFQHHSGSAHYSRTTNSEMAGNVLRLYDDHREDPSAFRNESRSRSQSRYDNERHHHSRR